MGLIRILVIALIIYLLIQVIKRWKTGNESASTMENPLQGNKMVRCEVCQLHIPENEALVENGKYYCCQEHYDSKR